MEKSGLTDIDQKVNEAWDQAKIEKLNEIITSETNNLAQQGIPPDAENFQAKLGERVMSRQTEKYDCWDKFQRKLEQMRTTHELQDTDYAKWEDAIGKYNAQTDMSTGRAPPSFGDRNNDFN